MILSNKQMKGKKRTIFKNCVPFTDCINEINKTQINNAKDIDNVMPMHNLIEYSNHYLNTSRTLWQYYKDEPNDNITNSESLRPKIKTTGNTPDAGNQENREIAVPLKY